MKKLFFLLISIIVIFSSCNKNEDFSEEKSLKESEELVVMNFFPYQFESLTRTTTSISNIVTHLDVWIVEGTNILDFHQASTNSSFGTISCVLNKTKTYTLYAIAHRCNGNATFENNIISFPDNKVGDSFYYTTTFTTSTIPTSCVMNRIVGQFRMETTDAIPDDCTQMKFTVLNTPCAYDVSTNSPVTLIDKVTHYTSINKDSEGKASFTVSILATSETSNYNILIQAMKEDNSIIEERTFENVPIKANYKTIYRGTFYISTLSNVNFSGDSDYNSTNTEVEF